MTARARAASVSAYLDELAQQRRLSAHTVRNYRHDLELLCGLSWLADRRANRPPVRALAPMPPASTPSQTHHIRRFVAQLHTRGLGGRSLGRTLSAWRGFYRWLGQRGMATQNPVDGVRPPRSPKGLPKVLSPDEANRLLETDPENLLAVRDQAIFELFYSSGLRLAELAALDLACLDDLLAGEVRVLGKRSKLRIVPVGSKAREAVALWAAQRAAWRRPTRALFVSQRGTRLGMRMIQLRLQRRGLRRACRRGCIRTCCAIPSPRTCCSPRATCARCRRCSATPVSPRRRSTPTSTFSIWPRSTIRRIRAPNASRNSCKAPQRRCRRTSHP
jgi:integrase/recombinase XerC